MAITEQGLAVIRSFEGLSLKAYKDEVGVWTIGYGQTNDDAKVLGFTIKDGVTITKAQAEALLRSSIARLYEPAVNKAMGDAGTTQASVLAARLDAGYSFHYNTGAIARATWVQKLKEGDMAGVHDSLVSWNHAGGKVLAGLTRRREREWAMIRAGDYGPEGKIDAPITDEKGKPLPTVPAPVPVPSTSHLTPWHARIESILGLYEFAGSADNPCILAMAKQCGAPIAKSYTHDSIAWCALTVNWCLVTTGYKATGTLWALDFRKAPMVKLTGPCPGAIATKTRDGGGHVFIVRGRTSAGQIVGTGGNQKDMVCDEAFDPSVLQYTWPAGVPLPPVGMATLPVVSVRPATHKTFTALPTLDHPATAAEAIQGPKIEAEAARMTAMQEKMTATAAVAAPATAGMGAVADQVATGSGSHWGLWIALAIAAALVIKVAWQYRDEIKAALAAKYGGSK